MLVLTNLPIIVVVVIAFVAAIMLSGLIIKAAKAFGRFIIFAAIFYILLILFGVL